MFKLKIISFVRAKEDFFSSAAVTAKFTFKVL